MKQSGSADRKKSSESRFAKWNRLSPCSPKQRRLMTELMLQIMKNKMFLYTAGKFETPKNSGAHHVVK